MITYKMTNTAFLANKNSAPPSQNFTSSRLHQVSFFHQGNQIGEIFSVGLQQEHPQLAGKVVLTRWKFRRNKGPKQ